MINATNPTLLNVTYIRPTKDEPEKECFEVIYKDDNNQPRKSEEPADADIYVVKPEYRNYTYNKPEERIERMDKIRVRISKIRDTIKDLSGDWGKDVIRRAGEANDFRMLNQLYAWPYCYACDFQPEYYYMKNWYEKYKLDNVKLTAAFLDIETDLIDYTLDMDDIPNTAYSPVTLVTVIMEETNEACTFILRPYEPPKFGKTEEEYKERYKLYLKQKTDHEYLMGHMKEFINDLHKSFDPTYGFINYHIREFEKEADLITDVFRFINDRKPNFCLSWNMRFDIQYLYYRLIVLGRNPKSIMCHPDFRDNRRCSFKVDRSTFLLEKQYDYFYCSSYTQYICQMRLYASIRKSQHKLKSVSLNAIGDRELKDKKVEYPDESNIVLFPFLNWIRFIKYNIKDVLLQKGIERKTKDVMTYYMRSHVNLTPYNKIFKETHLLRNVREIYFEQEGWVQGNNINIIGKNEEDEQTKRFYGLEESGDEEASFKGAINADPVWNDKIGMKILGVKSNNLIANAVDFDMGAFYPSIKIASNMDPITLIFKASFDNEEFISGEYSNRSLNTKYFEKDKNGVTRKLDFTGEAVNTYVSDNILTFGYNYLGLPSIPSLAEEIIKRMRG